MKAAPMTVQRFPWNAARAAAVVAPHAARRGGLLEALHALQDVFGFIHDDAVSLLADAFNLSRADVHGVVTFYHDYRDRPPGRRVVKICRADACRAVGSERLAEHAAARLGAAFGETTPDGETTLEPVYCLGLCAVGPAALIDGKAYARLTAERLDALLEGNARCP